jgi:hypothetical protein
VVAAAIFTGFEKSRSEIVFCTPERCLEKVHIVSVAHDLIGCPGAPGGGVPEVFAPLTYRNGPLRSMKASKLAEDTLTAFCVIHQRVMGAHTVFSTARLSNVAGIICPL